MEATIHGRDIFPSPELPLPVRRYEVALHGHALTELMVVAAGIAEHEVVGGRRRLLQHVAPAPRLRLALAGDEIAGARPGWPLAARFFFHCALVLLARAWTGLGRPPRRATWPGVSLELCRVDLRLLAEHAASQGLRTARPEAVKNARGECQMPECWKAGMAKSAISLRYSGIPAFGISHPLSPCA